MLCTSGIIIGVIILRIKQRNFFILGTQILKMQVIVFKERTKHHILIKVELLNNRNGFSFDLLKKTLLKLY